MAGVGLDVVIVVPPFASADMPMLGPSLLLAECRRRGLNGKIRYSNLRLARRVGYELYQRLALSSFSIMAGDLLFRDFAFPADLPLSKDTFDRFFADGSTITVAPPAIGAITREEIAYCSEVIGEFVADEAREISLERARIVGFSSVFQQTLASIAMARELKCLDPGAIVVLGGANTSAPMGKGLSQLRDTPFDFIIGGEADQVFPDFVLRATRGGGLPSQTVIDCPPLLELDQLAYPDFGDYFAEVDLLKQSRKETPDLAASLPIETSRGCWWGAKHHCTFCGLNGTEIGYRAKSAQRILAEIDSLRELHGVLRFQATDNIMPRFFKDHVLPVLALAGRDYRFFYEVKSNLSELELDLFVKAGVHSIQPGIESLSSNILRLVNKGVTGVQNIWLLRECASRQIAVTWNVLAGIPGDAAVDYRDTIRAIPALTHLHPPSAVSRIVVDRYSPYHERPASYGMSAVSPLPAYENLYPDGTDLAVIAYHFTALYESAYFSSPQLAEDLAAAIGTWTDAWADGTEPPKLYAVPLDAERLFIEDTRSCSKLRRNGLTASQTCLLRKLRRPLRTERIEMSEELALLLSLNYVIEHEGQFISVVVEPEKGFALRL